jgi:septal ring factor EnvC (AmiA/AmiB activator)
MILQIQTKAVETSTTIFLNYGAVGAMLVMCIVALIYMARFFIKQNERQSAQSRAEISELRNTINKYISDDRERMIKVIERNSETHTKLVDSIQDLREEIHELKKKPS